METETSGARGGATVTRLSRFLLGCRAGERLPKLHLLAGQFSCSNGTLQTAISTLENLGAAELESRGRSGTFVVNLDYSQLWELAGNRFISIVMPMPYSSRYEGLATGLQYSFSQSQIPLTTMFVRGAGHRIRVIGDGRADYAVVSGLVAKQEMGIESIHDYGAHSYVGEHGLLLRKDRTIDDPELRIALDPASPDQYAMTREILGELHGRTIVRASYQHIGTLFEKDLIDAAVWNFDGVAAHILNSVTLVPLPRSAGIAVNDDNTHAVVVRKSQHGPDPIAVLEAIRNPAVMQIANEVRDGKRMPSY